MLVELRFDPGTGEAPERIEDTEGEQLLDVSEKDGPFLWENLLAKRASCMAKSRSLLHPVNRMSTLQKGCKLALKIPTFFSRFRYSMETVCKLFKKVSKNLLLCINI